MIVHSQRARKLQLQIITFGRRTQNIIIDLTAFENRIFELTTWERGLVQVTGDKPAPYKITRIKYTVVEITGIKHRLEEGDIFECHILGTHARKNFAVKCTLVILDFLRGHVYPLVRYLLTVVSLEQAWFVRYF
ncbi:hypothetical protein D3C85_1543000 [compost metagenome]